MGYLCMPCSYFWVRTSEKVPYAKFAELRYGEVRRILIPRTPVNKAIYSTLELRFCLDEFLDVSKTPLHQAAHAILHRFIDGHVSTHR